MIPKRASALLFVPVLLVAGAWHVLTAQPGKTVEPDACLPPDTSVYINFSGAANVGPGIKKTAFYQTLDESGFWKLAEPALKNGIEWAMKSANPPPEAVETVKTIRKTIEHAVQHGVVAGIAAKANVDLVFVLPNATKGGLAQEIDTRAREFVALAGFPLRDLKVEGRKLAAVSQPVSGYQTLRTVHYCWWTEGDSFVFSIGYSDPETGPRRAAGKAPGLAASEKSARFGAKQDYSVGGRFWLDFKELLRNLPQDPNLIKAIDTLGISGLQGFKAQSGADGDSLRTDFDLMLDSPRKGFLKLVNAPKLEMEAFPKLPADTDMIIALAVDAVNVYDTFVGTIRETIKAVAPDEDQLREFDAGVRAADEQVGYKIRDDLATSLGPMALVYKSPGDGFFGFSAATLVVSVKDRSKLTGVLDRLGAAIRREDEKFFIERKQVEGADLWITGYREAGFPLTPTVALTDRWLAFSFMSPSPALRFVRQQSNQHDSWSAPERLRKSLQNAQGDVLLLSYSDPRPVAKSLVTVVPLLAGLLRNSAPELHIDLTLLPDLERMAEGFFPGSMVVAVDDRGVHGTAYTSVPVVGTTGGAAVASLAAVVLPAVQGARESARRSVVMNDQKQVGLGLHNYHDVEKSFPRGTAKEGKKLKVEQRLSWMAAILPYVAEQNTYQNLSFDEAWDSKWNKKSTDKSIVMFLNPNLPAGEQRNVTHIVGMAGVGENAASLKAGDKKAGIFGYDRKTALSDIRDGTSNTVMAIGANENIGPWAQGGASTVRGLSAQPYIGGPDGIGSTNNGVFALMADGSVRFLAKSIDPSVMEALATINGREVVNLDR